MSLDSSLPKQLAHLLEKRQKTDRRKPAAGVARKGDSVPAVERRRSDRRNASQAKARKR